MGAHHREARRYDEPLEEMSPELWRMVEQYHRYATDSPQTPSKRKRKRGGETGGRER